MRPVIHDSSVCARKPGSDMCCPACRTFYQRQAEAAGANLALREGEQLETRLRAEIQEAVEQTLGAAPERITERVLATVTRRLRYHKLIE